MTEPLFRREVLDARNAQWLGTVRLSSTRLAWPMAALAVVAIVVLLSILVFGSYTRKERVQGRLVPAAGLLAVVAPQDGVVTHVAVGEGGRAARGAALLELSADADAAGGRDGLSAAIGDELRHKRERLDADLGDLLTTQRQQADALRIEIASLARQQDAAAQRARLLDQQAAKARALLDRVRPLEKERIVSAVQIQGYESAALAAEAEAESGRRERLDAERGLAESRARLAALPIDIATRRNALQRDLADVSQDSARNRAIGGLALRAQRAGTVSGLSVQAGDSVRQGQRLLSLIPSGSPLRAELWVPSRAAGVLRVGTRVAMRYDAFPYQRYGQRFGRVVEVAGSASSPQEIETRTGLRRDAPAYRVVVAAERGDDALPLRAGMTVDADLLLERRRLYALLLDPLRRLDPPEPAR
jgi:membrane fusion protein